MELVPRPSALESFVDELYRWNQRINLTSVPREDAWRRHVGEAEHLLAVVNPHSRTRCADIGSGGGIPGLVIAVLRPDMHVTLIESDRRKAAFLTHAAAVCGAGNVEIIAERAEVVGHWPTHRQRFDLVVSRAAAPSPVLTELALPLLRIGGRLAALVRDAPAESRLSRIAAEICGGAEPTALSRDVLGVGKLAETPELYPRPAGVQRRKPLR